MAEVEITFRIPGTRHAAADRALACEVLRDASSPPEGTFTGPDRPDAGARLRGDLEQDFARARSWLELQDRLMAKGYRLREDGIGVTLHRHPEDTWLCGLSTLGISPFMLAMRFCRPFPPRTGPPGPAPPDLAMPDGTPTGS